MRSLTLDNVAFRDGVGWQMLDATNPIKIIACILQHHSNVDISSSAVSTFCRHDFVATNYINVCVVSGSTSSPNSKILTCCGLPGDKRQQVELCTNSENLDATY